LDSWSWTSMKKRIGRPGQILERGTEGENAGLKLRSGRPSSSSEQAIRIPRQILQPAASKVHQRRPSAFWAGSELLLLRRQRRDKPDRSNWACEMLPHKRAG